MDRYDKYGSQKEAVRQKFKELCKESTPMVKRTVCEKIGDLCGKAEKSVVMYELFSEFKKFLAIDEQVNAWLTNVNILNHRGRWTKSD